jgi:uncharacterized protein (TIGR01777 family)
VRVAIAGGNGFVGRALTRELIRAEHEVVWLSHSPGRAGAQPAEARPVSECAFLPEEPGADWCEEVARADALVNLSGHPVASRWDDGVKRSLRDSRIGTTRALVEAILALPEEHRPSVFVNASAVGVYGDRGDDVLSEDEPPGEDWLACLARDWEAEAARIAEDGVREVRIRTGIALGEEGVLPRMLTPMRLGVGGPLGDGRQWMSWVHVDDLARLYRHAIETPAVSGALNGGAPDPVRMARFASTLGRILHRPSWFRVGRTELSALMGEVADSMLMSQRMDAGKAVASGFVFAFPAAEDALRDLVHNRR